jgi:formate dehydrogenase iron-sulfur subunit
METILSLNRRRFLKSATAAAVIGAAGALSVPRRAEAGEGRLATLIDLTRCDGCADREAPACASACKKIKEGKLPEPVAPIPVPFPTDPLQPDYCPEGGGGCGR